MTELIEMSRSDCNVTQSCFTSQNKFNDPSCRTVIDGELEALVESLLDSQLASLATLPYTLSNDTDDLMSMTLEELEMEAELARIEFIECLLSRIKPFVLDWMKSRSF